MVFSYEKKEKETETKTVKEEEENLKKTQDLNPYIIFMHQTVSWLK